MSPQAANQRPFSTDDARKALVIRGYTLTVESKLIALLQSDVFDEAIVKLRHLLKEFETLQQQAAGQPCRCYDGYECCNGICEVWCS